MADQSTLEQIVADTNTALVQSSTAESVQRDNARKASDAANANAELYKTIASNQALVIATQKTAEMNAQKATLRAANAAGVDPTAAGDEITKIVSNIHDTNNELNGLVRTYRNLSDTQFLDHPIDWMKAQIALPTIERKIKEASQESVIYNSQLENINKNISQVANTQDKIKESVTAASASASASSAAALALIQSNEAQIQAYKYNSEEVNVALNASKERLSFQYNIKNAQNQEIVLQKQLDSLKLQQEEFDWRREEKKAADQAKLEGKQLDESVIDTINIGRASRGVNPVTGPEAKTMLQVLKNKGAGSAELELDYQNGQRTRIAGIPILGATPAETINVLASLPATVSSAREATVAILSRAQAALEANKAIDHKDKAAQASFINNFVKQDVAGMYRRVQPGTDNVFDIGDLGSYFTMSAAQNLPVVSKVLGPAFTAGQPMTDPKVVFGLVGSAVQKGTLTSTEAQDLATVYQVANSVNLASRGLTGFGITVPQNGKAYNVAWSIGTTYNMTDPTVIGRMLAEDLARRNYNVLGFPGNPDPNRNILINKFPLGTVPTSKDIYGTR